MAPHKTDTRQRIREGFVQGGFVTFPVQADVDLARPACGSFQKRTRLGASLIGTGLERMRVFGQHGCDLVMALPRESCYSFLQNPQLQIATPPPTIDRVAAAGHLHRSSRQPSILVSQLVICQCVYRRTHRLTDGEFIAVLAEKTHPPRLPLTSASNPFGLWHRI